MIYIYLVHEKDAMEAERDDMLGVRPVYRSHVRGIEQHDVALLSRSIKPNGHQDSIIFLNTIWVSNKAGLTIVLVLLQIRVITSTPSDFILPRRTSSPRPARRHSS